LAGNAFLIKFTIPFPNLGIPIKGTATNHGSAIIALTNSAPTNPGCFLMRLPNSLKLKSPPSSKR